VFKFQSAVQRWVFLATLCLVPAVGIGEGPVINTSKSAEELAAEEARSVRQSCSDATKEYNKDATEMLEICASLPGDQGGGLSACIQRLNCCVDLEGDSCPSGDSSVHASSIEKNKTLIEALLDQMSNTPADSPQMSQLEAMKEQTEKLQSVNKIYAACPERSAVDLDKAYEEAEEAREKFEEREEAINEIKEQIIEAQQKLEEDKLKIEKEMKELELNTQKDIKEIQDQQEDAMKQLLEQIEAQEGRKRELLSAISEQENGKSNAYDAMNQKITELKVACYQEGVKKAQDTRAKVLEKAANNQYSAGNLETLYKSVGSSTLEDTQKLVEYHRKLCESSYVVKESVKLAQTLYNRAIDVADKNISAIRQEITLVELKIGRLQTDEKAKIHKDTMERIALLSKGYEDGVSQLTKQYDTTVKAASARISQLQQQLAQKQAHLQAAKDHLSYKQGLLEMRKKSNPADTSVGGDIWAKGIAAAQRIKISAGTAYEYCCQNGKTGGICNSVSGLDSSGADTAQ
jgi:hypothetical protein